MSQPSGVTPADGRSAFPWRVGETVDGPWHIEAIDRIDGLRFHLARADGERVTFRLSKSTSVAAPGELERAGVQATWRTSSTLTPAAFREAGRVLLDRLLDRGGEPDSWLASDGNDRRVRLDLDALRAGGRSDLAAGLPESTTSSLTPVDLTTRVLDRAALGLVRRAQDAELPEVRLSLLGLASLAASALRELVDRPERLALEVRLEAAPSAPAEWERLAAGLRICAEADCPARVMLEVTPATARDSDAVARLAATVAACRSEPLHLQMGSVSARAAAGAPVASFSEAAPLFSLAVGHPRLLVARSEDGYPACLVPAVVRKRGGRTGSGARVFGPTCESCPERTSCDGLSQAYAARFGTDELQAPSESDDRWSPPMRVDWQDQARLLLIGRPRARLRLEEVMPADALPPWKCTLPWRRLERTSNGAYGPCCADYLADVRFAPPDTPPADLWNGDYLRSIRRAMAGDGTPSTCGAGCPILRGGTERADSLVIRGGSPEVVESQLRLVEEMCAGAEEVSVPPFELGLAVTSHCNYDCIMCMVEDHGPDDQLGASFFDGLEEWLDRVMVLDANGGEPLASSTFRRFLESVDFERHPQLRVHLTTNGSFLTPSKLAGYLRVPFSSLTVSLNAATAKTYLEVNRGLGWERIRGNLHGLLQATRDGRLSAAIRYSLVVLRCNLDEVVPFARMALDDGVGVRYLLPTGNRGGQSVMLTRSDLERASDALRAARELLEQSGTSGDARDIDGLVDLLESRRRAGVLEPL